LKINYCFQTKKILANLSFAICYLVTYILINLQVNLIKIFLLLLLILEKEIFTKYLTKYLLIIYCLFWEKKTNILNKIWILILNFKYSNYRQLLTTIF